MDKLQFKKTDYNENIHCVNPLYLMIGKVDRYIKEKNGSKYLVFDSADENKEVLKNIQNFGMVLLKTVKQVNMVKISSKLNLELMMIRH